MTAPRRVRPRRPPILARVLAPAALPALLATAPAATATPAMPATPTAPTTAHATPAPPASRAPASASGQLPAIDPYLRGLDMIERGNVEGGLSFWIAVRDSLAELGEEDARIATAFIGIVTDRELVRYEEIASVIFLWGFSGNAVREAARDEILAEGRRTFTVADSAAIEYWDAVGREDPAALAQAIKQFWLERDPTPATLLNERLIEHWRRIAFARRNFRYNNMSPYRTDDRGTFYIKYGQPDRVTRGVLAASEAELRERNVQVDEITRFDLRPQYEIWRYANMHPPDFTYFLFGNTEGTGPFRHVEGLHEMLPSSARMAGEASIDGIRAQHYLELFYYQDLARMGGPYGQRFAELDRLWTMSFPRPRPTEGSLSAASFRHLADDRFAARQAAPPPISEFDDRPRSALSAQAVRILDDGLPRILVMAVSSPIWLPSIHPDSIGNTLALDAWTASHTVIVRDRALTEIARAGMLAVDGPGHLSTLLLRHESAVRHLSVSARHDVQDDPDPATGRGDTSEAEPPRRLPGHEHFAVGAPLLALGDSVPFEASDLAGTVVLVGVPHPDMTIELPFIEVFGRGGALKSSWYGDCLPSRDFPMLIDLYLQGRLDLDGFVSETIGLGDVEEAFHKMERGEVLRSVVVL